MLIYSLSGNLRSNSPLDIEPETYKRVWNNFKGQPGIYQSGMPTIDETIGPIVDSDLKHLKRLKGITQQEKNVPDQNYRRLFANRIDPIIEHFEPLLVK